MSEEDAALFWEVDSHPAPGPGDNSIGPELAERTVPVTKEIVPEKKTVARFMPNGKPEDPQRTSMCNKPMSDSQDTKPADSARRARVQERTGVPEDNSMTPGSLRLQASTGTQTDETISTRTETLKENEAPETLKETLTPGPEQHVNNKTQPGGRRRANTETPDRRELECDNPWTLLPFAEAT